MVVGVLVNSSIIYNSGGDITMGMYDTIYCSKDLGAGFWNRELQTKDLDCLMAEYWISPSGQLFEIDYSGTQDFVENPDNDNAFWRAGLWKPNGNHGHIRATRVTKVIEVYPTHFDCKYAPYPRLHLYLKDGILQEVIDTTPTDDIPLTEERSY